MELGNVATRFLERVRRDTLVETPDSSSVDSTNSSFKCPSFVVRLMHEWEHAYVFENVTVSSMGGLIDVIKTEFGINISDDQLVLSKGPPACERLEDLDQVKAFLGYEGFVFILSINGQT